MISARMSYYKSTAPASRLFVKDKPHHSVYVAAPVRFEHLDGCLANQGYAMLILHACDTHAITQDTGGMMVSITLDLYS